MSVVYWSIPLCLLAIAIAVVPVLYGSLRHQYWAEDTPRPSPTLVLVDAGPARDVAARPDAARLEEAYGEATAILARLERLRTVWGFEDTEPASVASS